MRRFIKIIMGNEIEKLIQEGYTYVEGLPPIVFEGAKTLILGSLPGIKSLENKMYYANKRNRFWLVMAEKFGIAPFQSDEERIKFLEEHHIALWDVYKSGYRRGSRDGIKGGKLNDINELLVRYPTIIQIVVAGNDALKALSTIEGINIRVIPVPSTSGGNGHWNEKKQRWYDIEY